MDIARMQQVPPQPAPGDLPIPPAPDGPAAPLGDPTQAPPPVQDPDVVDPSPGPGGPMIA